MRRCSDQWIWGSNKPPNRDCGATVLRLHIGADGCYVGGPGPHKGNGAIKITEDTLRARDREYAKWALVLYY